MKTDEVIILNEKAKTRKNGVYSFRDNFYAVKDNKFIAFADPFGECFQVIGSFTVSIGKCSRQIRKDMLSSWLKNL